MKQIGRFFITVALVAICSFSYPCSMFKLCINGKTWVGNNEDYWNPESLVWVSKKTQTEFGVVYFGFDNFFPQGGINERGLVFDGFSTPGKENMPPSPAGTKPITNYDFITQAMSTCSTIDDIRKLLTTYSLDYLKTAQLMFVDSNGNSIIIEGGTVLIESHKNYQIATNFYQSDISPSNAITCERYLNAQTMLESRPESSVDYCTSILEKVHQHGYWGGTQYSTIYDPKEGLIYLYLFHNFAEVVTLSVAGLINQKDYVKPLRSMFTSKASYKEYRENYFTTQNLAIELGKIGSRDSLRKSIKQLDGIEQSAIWTEQLIASSRQQRARSLDYNAVEILKFTCKIAPKNWKAAQALAEVYLHCHNINEALRHVDRALALKPEELSLKELREAILKSKP